MMEKLSGRLRLINGVIEMSLNRELIPLILGIIIISSIFFTGCITTNPLGNTSQQQTPTSPMVPTQTITNLSITSEIPITTALETTNIPPTLLPEPVFTETGRPMTDVNGTRILSKVQAWSYAEKYLAQHELRNIQAAEVTAHDPTVFTDRNKTQTLIWTFKIDRKSSMGFERGGIIAIDAYNGHVVWYNQLM